MPPKNPEVFRENKKKAFAMIKSEVTFQVPHLSPSLEQARKELQTFLSSVSQYSQKRNHVIKGNENVSQLSPYLSHGVLTEYEVAGAVLEQYSLSTVEKFIQEVYWRRYWKGWLAHRLDVWTDYRSSLTKMNENLSADDAEKVEAIKRGESEIEIMGYFARQLRETGYLHNHARMWFAAYWVHHEKLPWQLGAEFFYEHLLDADAASNTLSWRWVAGLQTVGKTYLARASNIRKYVQASLLQQHEVGLSKLESPSAANVAFEANPPASAPENPPFITETQIKELEQVGILLHNESFNTTLNTLISAPTLLAYEAYSPKSEVKHDWKNKLMSSISESSAHSSVCIRSEADSLAQSIVKFCELHSVKNLLIPFAEVGHVRDELHLALKELSEHELTVHYFRDSRDSEIEQYAKKGFFPFWKTLQKELKAGKYYDKSQLNLL